MSTQECISVDCIKRGAENPGLLGKHAAMVVFSRYPDDPRPRRAVDALLAEGMSVDLLCESVQGASKHEMIDKLTITRIPITHERAGVFSYVYQYLAFTLIAAMILTRRALGRHYDLVYVHNMPDMLVFCSLIPKWLGAKVILDQHDPMPELMTAIFDLDEKSPAIRMIKMLEKWSMSCADLVITVNIGCKRLFGSRSCPPGKIDVVMNSPDNEIFPFYHASSYLERSQREPFVIMFHGSLVERNGLMLAVDSLARVRETIPSAELHVYGKATPYLERVKEYAAQKGIKQAMRFYGQRKLEELVIDIQRCDVGVIPNEQNAFTKINTPTRIFEYLALGRPVVVPNTPGIQDYFAPGSLHFFDAGSAEQLAAQILEIHADPVSASAITERGQAVYREHDWRIERQRLIDLVSNLLNKDGSRWSGSRA
jgi:glycosyltransferase involved in cell wall biosynthesis